MLAKADYPVAAKTRERVIDAARRINFVPNALAWSLFRSRSDSIGIVVPSLINPYSTAMIEGIDAAASDRGLTMLLALSNWDETRRETFIQGFLARQVDGLLICAVANDCLPGRDPEAIGVPTVLIGQQPNAGLPRIAWVRRR